MKASRAPNEVGLDSQRFEQHEYQGEVRETVERDLALARDIKLELPTEVTIHGERYAGKLMAERLIAAARERD